MKYTLGFSWKGLLVFILPMLPNLLYFWLPKDSASRLANGSHLVLDIIEHGSQTVFVMLMVFMINQQKTPIVKGPFFSAACVLLLAYFLLWNFCFAGKGSFPVLMAMAVVPVVYFLLAQLWLGNYLAMIPTILFGIVHAIVTYIDFAPVKAI